MSLRDVGFLLHQIGDAAGAADWATVTVALDEPPVVALFGAAPLSLPPTIATLRPEQLSAALPVHAALYCTPYAAALGTDDRERLEQRGVLPVAVVLTERATLEQLSDDPEREAQEVFDRVAALVPSGVVVLTEPEVDAWLTQLSGAEHLAQRRFSFALHLLDRAQQQRQERLSQLQVELDSTQTALAQLDTEARQAARRGEQVAAGVRAAAMSAGEGLLAELEDFFHQLRTHLPREISAIDNWQILRDTLGPWLQTVITEGVEQRLHRWRAHLLQEVGPLLSHDEQQQAIGEQPSDVELAELSHLASWRDRLPIALGLGGGIALLALGQLVPGTLTVFTSLAWRSATRQARRAGRRDALLHSAQMVVDVARLETLSEMRSRQQALLNALDELPASRAQRVRNQQSSARSTHSAHLEALQQERSRLKLELQELKQARQGWSEASCRL